MRTSVIRAAAAAAVYPSGLPAWLIPVLIAAAIIGVACFFKVVSARGRGHYHPRGYSSPTIVSDRGDWDDAAGSSSGGSSGSW